MKKVLTVLALLSVPCMAEDSVVEETVDANELIMRYEADAKIVKRISTKYKLDEKSVAKIVEAARENERVDFPKFSDIMGVIEVESSFKPSARNSGCIGLMQLKGKYHGGRLNEIEVNVRKGSNYLRAMYERFGDRKAAFLSYNAGPAAYEKEKRAKKEYYRKVHAASLQYLM